MKRLIKEKSVFLRVLVLGVVLLFVFSSVAVSYPRFFTIAAGPIGGEWYVLGGILGELVKAEFPDMKVSVKTGGAVSNPTRVSRKKADLAMTQDQLFYLAYNNKPPFSKYGDHSNLRGLAYLGDIFMGVFITPKDSKYKSMKQIVEKKLPVRIVTAPRASSPSRATERILKAYGITPEKLKKWGGKLIYASYAEGASLIRDGHADIWCGPIMPAVIELAVARPLRVIPVDDSVLKELNRKYKYGINLFLREATPSLPEISKRLQNLLFS